MSRNGPPLIAVRPVARASSSRSSSACIGEKSRSRRNAAAAASRRSTGSSDGASTRSATARKAASGARPISSDSASSTPSSAATSRTVSQTSHSGVTVKSRMFIETWARPSSSIQKPLAWTLGSPPPDSRTRRAIRLASSTSLRGQVDVVGDQERSGADGDRTGRRMEMRRAEVRGTAGLLDLVLEPLVLTAPDVGQLHPLGACRGVRVQEDREVEAGRDPGAELARHLDGVVHRRRAERHERDDIDGPDARVLAGVAVHVDLVDRDLDQPFEGVGDRIVFAGDGEDRPVVAGVARPVEQEDAVAGLDGARHPVDDIEASALRHVRDGFDQHLTMLVRRRSVRAPSAHGR